ncbi:MAG: segregation/condensation protein A [Candidatus Colwellbacteria bacterium]
MYELKLDQFSGPIEKLLELIEGKKLEVNRFSMAEVTADFFKYVDSLEEVKPGILADFIAVAAKLILIKSHALLPELKLEDEEELEIAELENRLKFYGEFRQAEESLKGLWQKKISFGRAYLANLPPGFYLTQELTPSDLLKEIERMAAELVILNPAVKEEKIKLITMEEKLSELMERLDRALENSFNNIMEGKERSEIIVLFLALLHLLKEATVKVRQDKLFSDIKIAKNKV